jgi:hypothetical protein
MTRFSYLFNYHSITFAFLLAAASARAEVMYSMQLKGTELPVGTLLEWATNYENDMQLYVLEKSTDGLHFEDLGTVQAAGFSAVDKNYHFMDLGATAKRSFYRLRELTTDGTASFSATSTVDKKLSNQYSVVSMSRTEVTKEFKISLDCITEGKLDWAILNNKNAEVETGSITMINGLNDLRLDFQNLPVGTYKIMMMLNTEIEQLVVARVSDGVSDKPNVASTRKLPTTGRN